VSRSAPSQPNLPAIAPEKKSANIIDTRTSAEFFAVKDRENAGEFRIAVLERRKVGWRFYIYDRKL